MLKALPGLAQSGCLWHTFADEAAGSNGWKRVEDIADDIYVKEAGRHLLPMYVDDVLIGGKGSRLQAELKALERHSSPGESLDLT